MTFMYLLTLLFWLGGVWCAMPHRAAARFFFIIIVHLFFAHDIIWEDDEAAGGSVDCGGRGARTDSVLRVARCHPRRRGNVPRQPGWDEEACGGGGGGGDGGHLSSSPLPPASIPLSFTDLYWASAFFSSRPLFWGSRLRPAFLLVFCGLPFIHLTYLASRRRPMKALISAGGSGGGGRGWR